MYKYTIWGHSIINYVLHLVRGGEGSITMGPYANREEGWQFQCKRSHITFSNLVPIQKLLAVSTRFFVSAIKVPNLLYLLFFFLFD